MQNNAEYYEAKANQAVATASECREDLVDFNMARAQVFATLSVAAALENMSEDRDA